VVSYLWSFGDGQTSSQAVATHTYSAAGSYAVQLTVTDDDGASASTSPQQLVVAGAGGGGQNQRPIANGSIRTSGGGPAVAGEPITFDASSSSDPDGQVVSYLWSFGDGQTSSQAVATHTYSAAGTYPISIMVTDNQGARDTTAVNLSVSQGQGGGGACRLTVTPASGSVAPGASQTLTVTYDASDISEGSYSGTIAIGGNGGTVTLPVAVTVSSAVSSDAPERANARIELMTNRPNPFAHATEIPLRLREATDLRVVVYNAIGRRVRVLADARLPAGTTALTWDGRDDSGVESPSGLYFVRAEPSNGIGVVTQRILKVR
jgi:PKD repeat protein